MTKDGAIREYSETLSDGRTIIYSVEVEEEVLEDQQDIEIASSKTVSTCTAEGTGGVLDTVRSVVEGEEITVLRTFSRTVSREDWTSTEIIRSKEKEEGGTVSLEFSRSNGSEKDVNCVERDSEGIVDHIKKTEEEGGPAYKTIVSENGLLITEL